MNFFKKYLIILLAGLIIMIFGVEIVVLNSKITNIREELKIKTNSVNLLQDYIDKDRFHFFEFKGVGVTTLSNNHIFSVGDTMFAEVHLTAFNIIDPNNRKSFIVYQVLNNNEYNSLDNTDNLSDYFHDKVETDTITLDSHYIPLSYSTTIEGDYYLRGILFIPLSSRYAESYTGLPFQKNIRFTN